MKFMMSACVAAVVLAIAPAHAEKFDLSTVTCKQFFENTKSDSTGVILGWLHGYYREENDPPIINMDEFKTDMEKFGAFCAINPTLSIISAADKVFGK